jgi:hypothetical protein
LAFHNPEKSIFVKDFFTSLKRLRKWKKMAYPIFMDYATWFKQYLREEEGDSVYLEDPSLLFSSPKPKEKKILPPVKPQVAPSRPLVTKTPISEPKVEEEKPKTENKIVAEKKEELTPLYEDSFSDIQASVRKLYPSFKILSPATFKRNDASSALLFARLEEEKDLPFWQRFLDAVNKNIAPVQEVTIEAGQNAKELLENYLKQKEYRCLFATPSLSSDFPISYGNVRYVAGTPLFILESAAHYEQNPQQKRKLWNLLKTFS